MYAAAASCCRPHPLKSSFELSLIRSSPTAAPAIRALPQPRESSRYSVEASSTLAMFLGRRADMECVLQRMIGRALRIRCRARRWRVSLGEWRCAPLLRDAIALMATNPHTLPCLAQLRHFPLALPPRHTRTALTLRVLICSAYAHYRNSSICTRMTQTSPRTFLLAASRPCG